MAADHDWTSVCLKGGKMSAGEAASLELELFSTPDNVDVRVRLLGYYFLNRTPETRTRRNGHIFWIIEHRPEVELHAYGFIHQRDDPSAYGTAKQLWTNVIASRGNDTAVLRRASDFFMINDRTLANDLLRRGAVLEPNEAHWRNRLAFSHSLDARRAESPEARAQSGQHALQEYETALGLETSAEGRFCLMIEAAQAAVMAVNYPRATEHAQRVLAEASDFEDSWAYGNGIHYGNIVLGHVALSNNDVSGACEHLAAAGATPGSPQLNSFGPDQNLAVELVARGECDAVIAYVDACSEFCSRPLEKIAAALHAHE